MDVDALRRRSTDLLLDRIEETRFPSNDYMNRVETSLATDEQAERYVNMLMQNLEDVRYPSPQLLERARRVLDHLAASRPARERGDSE